MGSPDEVEKRAVTVKVSFKLTVLLLKATEEEPLAKTLIVKMLKRTQTVRIIAADFLKILFINFSLLLYFGKSEQMLLNSGEV